MPERIQLSRKRGWRKPKGAVVVARPSKWGNPFRVGYIRKFVNDADPMDVVLLSTPNVMAAVANFRWLVEQPGRVEMIRAELAGRDLACWCPLGSPCHADVLLQIANTPSDATITHHQEQT